ncbi:MAG: hypothetical protein DRP74_06200 [Candidatus Omnitrophota bacterium]|nr:MAG: hypothetical protein DRP74_06200 [Candidatus Omnitrophota bacterium]
MKLLISALFFTVSILLSAAAGYSFWIWSPKSQKLVDPKRQPQPNPQEQLDSAKKLFEAKEYDQARREFNRLLKVYPRSAEAADAQYYLGLIEEAADNLYEAYLAYQKVIDKYPFSEMIPDIIEREYKIAEIFMSGQKRKVLGVLPVENPAIEIFSKVIENSTYGPLAPAAQYKLGLMLKSLARYYEAEEAFNKVITNYPGSEWVAAAKYQIATCRAAVSRGPEYDQGAAKEAKEKFQEFIKDHPDAALSKEAQKNIDELKAKEAEAKFNIGRFYEKQGEYEAAKIYYNDVIKNYPKSSWAVRSLERIKIMENRK